MASNQKLMEVQVTMDADAAIRANKQFFDQIVGDGKNAFAQLTSAQKSQINTLLGGTEKTVIDVVWNSNTKEIEQSWRQVYSALDPIESKIRKIESVEQGSLTNIRQRLNNLRQERDSIAALVIETDRFGKQTEAVNPRWQSINNEVRKLQKELNIAGASNFWDQFKAKIDLSQFLAVGKSINEIVQTFQSVFIIVGQVTAAFNDVAKALSTVSEFQLTFKAIGQGAAGGAIALRSAAEIALRLGADLNTVQDGFKKLAPTVLQTGGSMKDVAAITESLSSRFAVFGLGADESRRVMNGVIQAFGKGKLMAEELTQQISEADKAFTVDFANALGVTTTELYKMVKNGEITSDVIRRIIPEMSRASEVTGKLGTTGLSAAQAMGGIGVTIQMVPNQFNTLNALNLRAFADQFSPIVKAVYIVQGSVIDLISTVVKLEIFKTIGNIINIVAIEMANITTIILKVISGILELINSVTKVTSIIDDWVVSLGGIPPIAALIATYITTKLVVALTQLTVATIPATIAAITRFGAALLSPQGITAGFISIIGRLTTALDGLAAAQAAKTAGQAASVAASTAVTAASGGVTTALAAETIATGTATTANSAMAATLALARGELTGLAATAPVATSGIVATTAATKIAAISNLDLGVAINALKTAFINAIPALLELLPLLGAFALVGVSVAMVADEISKSFNGQKEYIKASSDVLKDLDDAWSKFNQTTQDTPSKLQQFSSQLEQAKLKAESSKNVLQQFWGFITQADTTSMNASDRAITAIKSSIDSLDGKYMEITNSIRTYNAETDKGTAKQTELEGKVKALSNAYDGIISGANAYIKTLQDQKLANGTLTQEEENRLKELNRLVLTTEEAKNAMVKFAESKGLAGQISSVNEQEVTALDTMKYRLQDLKYAKDQLKEKVEMKINIKVEGLEKLKEATKLKSEENIKALEAQRTLLQSNTNNAINNIDREKRASDYKYAVATASIQSQKSREDLRHQSALANLDAESARIDQNRRAGIAAVEARAAAEQAANTARMAQLDAESKALQTKANYERDSAERSYQIRRLQREAGYVQDPRVVADLQDQIAFLQQIQAIEDERNRKEIENINAIAAAKAAAAAIEASAATQKAAQEGAAAAAKDQLDQQRRQEELTHQANIKRLEEEERQKQQEQRAQDLAFENEKVRIKDESQRREVEINKQIDEEKAAQQAREKAIDKEIADLKKQAKKEQSKYDQDINSLEREIELASRKTAQNTNNAASATQRAADNANTYANNLSRAADQAERAARALRSGGSGQTSGNSNPSYRLGNQYTGPAYASGGPIQGGMVATVNELGREAFLGKSGVLSWINKPRWGQWRAPESGVVIPHHLTAGLRIPRGGVNINTAGLHGAIASYGSNGGAVSTNRITNNVTIQSTTPVQDASRMMIEMSKMRTRLR